MKPIWYNLGSAKCENWRCFVHPFCSEQFPTAMQLGFNLWAWTWCNISRPRKSGTLGGGTGGTYGTRCPGTFAFLEPKEFLEPVEPVKRMGFHRFQAFLGFKHVMVPQVPHRFHTGSTQVPHRFHTGSTQVPHRFHTGSTQVPWVQPWNCGNCGGYEFR